MVEITSKDNPLIKNIAKLNKSSRQRREQSLFAAEGLRLCEDAMLSKCSIKAVVCTDSALKKYGGVLNRLINYADCAYSVTSSLFAAVSDTKSPQGVLCLIKTLDKPTLFDKIKSNGKFLALENIQDPGNLGTIFRTAEAVGIDGIILSGDCCDIYSPKAVRATMGAVFRIPCLTVDCVSSFLREHKELRSFAAVVDKGAKSIAEISFSAPCVCVIGNEANGLRQETICECDDRFTIPMAGRAESLNASVAASIVMWEMIR